MNLSARLEIAGHFCIILTHMNHFIPGKLYRPKPNDFPNNGKLRNVMFYALGDDVLDNPKYLPPENECIMLILEINYCQRHKRSMRVGMHEPITVYMKHMKVMINDEMGYVSQWEDDWVMI